MTMKTWINVGKRKRRSSRRRRRRRKKRKRRRKRRRRGRRRSLNPLDDPSSLETASLIDHLCW